ncbi:polyprenol monophosphomannose synthase [bacterium]|nr:polyprenol monophosphomannose synthase [bacterium]
MKELLIVPTYNEYENIKPFIVDAFKYVNTVLIVDDSSPDGTTKIIKELQKEYSNLFLISRKKKLGLGSAYRDGFAWGLKRDFSHFIQMDADFSHQFKDLKKMLNFCQKYEVIIGSRYILGGKTEGWRNSRKQLSKFANIYSKFITKSKVLDMTSGFRVYSKKSLEKIDYSKTTSDGYSFQIEMTVRASRNNLEIKEIPITFSERREGKSKMNYKIVLEALYKVIKFAVIKN